MTIITRLVLAALVAATAIGCGALYTDIRVPRAYRSAAPSDVTATPSDETVVGEACYQSLLLLFAWGDASYATAARNALDGHTDATLYDVKADQRATTYLVGLYSQVCTVLTGKVGRP
jgi:TRL-like protein family